MLNFDVYLIKLYVNHNLQSIRFVIWWLANVCHINVTEWRELRHVISGTWHWLKSSYKTSGHKVARTFNVCKLFTLHGESLLLSSGMFLGWGGPGRNPIPKNTLLKKIFFKCSLQKFGLVICMRHKWYTYFILHRFFNHSYVNKPQGCVI